MYYQDPHNKEHLERILIKHVIRCDQGVLVRDLLLYHTENFG